MKIQSINNHKSFQGIVKLKANTMTPFDVEYIKKGAPKICEYAESVAPDFIIFKDGHKSMFIKAIKDNKEITSPILGYNVEEHSNIIEAVIDTMKNLVKSI